MWILVVILMVVWSVDVKGIKFDLIGRFYCIVFVYNVIDY